MPIDVDAHRQITDALLTYCRGIDRLDGKTVSAAFHPGAELEGYGPEPMSIEVFVEHALPSLGAKYVATQHRVSNLLVEDHPDGARLEAYVLASHYSRGDDGDDGDQLMTFAGRYVDTVTQRNGAWRIAHRHLRHDWSTIEQVDSAHRPTWLQSGRDGTPDPLDD